MRKVTIKVNVRGEIHTVSFKDDFVQITPHSKLIAETCEEMFQDIGTYDSEYFKELIQDNSSFYMS